jgi:hypothetical protein
MEPETQNGNQSQGDEKSKKPLYIVIGVVVVLVLGWFFTGGMMRSVTGVDVQRSLDGSATYSNSEGSVTVGANKMPDNWPSDAPTYPNAQIQSAVTSNPQTGQAGSAVIFITSDSIQAVTDFYKKELATQGWSVEQTVSMGTGTMLAATKDTRDFGVYIADSGDGNVSVSATVSMPQ